MSWIARSQGNPFCSVLGSLFRDSDCLKETQVCGVYSFCPVPSLSLEIPTSSPLLSALFYYLPPCHLFSDPIVLLLRLQESQILSGFQLQRAARGRLTNVVLAAVLESVSKVHDSITTSTQCLGYRSPSLWMPLRRCSLECTYGG